MQISYSISKLNKTYGNQSGWKSELPVNVQRKPSLANVPESCDALCRINRDVRETKLCYESVCLKTGATSRLPASQIEFPVRIAS
jgi:hypothetical protein